MRMNKLFALTGRDEYPLTYRKQTNGAEAFFDRNSRLPGPGLTLSPYQANAARSEANLEAWPSSLPNMVSIDTLTNHDRIDQPSRLCELEHSIPMWKYCSATRDGINFERIHKIERHPGVDFSTELHQVQDTIKKSKARRTRISTLNTSRRKDTVIVPRSTRIDLANMNFPPPPQQPLLNLPPQMQPQQYSHQQSRSPSPSPARMQPTPIPPMKLDSNEIVNATTRQPIFGTTIEKSSFSGSKKGYTLHQHWTGQPIAYIKFSSMETNKIQLTMHGAPTTIKEDGFLHFRWCLGPVAFPGKTWTWTEKHRKFELRDEGGVLLARIDGDILFVEPMGMPERAVDEVVASAFAMWLQKRKEKREGQAADGAGEVVGALIG